MSALVSGVLLLAMVGGWVWALSGEAAAIARSASDIVALQHDRDVQDDRMRSMFDRLARMEPMLQFLVDRATKDMKP